MVAADLAAFLLFGAFFSFIFLASLLMQQLLQYSPTRTGVAWLATSVTAFVAAGITGASLVGRFGVKRLLVAGLTLGGDRHGAADPDRARRPLRRDLLPAFLLAGLAIGMSAPSVQIGALTGVAPQTVGLASGLVETMREIGGAVGIAAVSTVLASRHQRRRGARRPARRARRRCSTASSRRSPSPSSSPCSALLVAAIAFPRTPSGATAADEPTDGSAGAPDELAPVVAAAGGQ